MSKRLREATDLPLPDDVLHGVISWLDAKSTASLNVVNKHLQELTTNGEHWTLLYAKDFGRLQFLEGKSPKERYRGRSELHKQADFCRQQVSSADPAVRRAAADFLQMRGRLVLRHLLRRYPTHALNADTPAGRVLWIARETSLRRQWLRLPSIPANRAIEYGAVLIARLGNPALAHGEVAAKLDALAERVRQQLARNKDAELTARPLRDQLEAVNLVLFGECKFRGCEADAYYRPDNSFIDRVLETKRGIPIGLSVVYMAVAERLGVHVVGQNTPGHFILKAVQRTESKGGAGSAGSAGSASDAPLWVDPFHQSIMDAEEAHAMFSESMDLDTLLSGRLDCQPIDVFSRMLSNLAYLPSTTRYPGMAELVRSMMIALFLVVQRLESADGVTAEQALQKYRVTQVR